VRVIGDPWAEVWSDGKLLDTTPIARPLSLPEGAHKIELRNPYFELVTRDVQVKRGETQTLRVGLRK
jgi:serine/threonine-protein kinase